VQSTGTSVTASSVAPTIAKVFVQASGWKSFPSWPVSAKIGTKASTMMPIAKKIGRPTCCEAASTVCQVSSAVSRRPRAVSACSQCRITFSVVTMPASTSTPMAMAIPVSDMMCEVMPNSFIRINAIRIEAGSGSVTVRMLRK